MMAIRGVKRFFRTVRLLGKEVDYILPTFHDQRVAKTGRILAKLHTHFGQRVLDKISYASTISEAAGAGLTIFEYRPKQRIAEEYSELAKRIDNGTLP
jgi:cellulose biosynthesis protein BcsQ